MPGYEFKSADEYLYGDSVVFFTCARKKIVRWPNRRVHVCPPLKRKIDRASLRLLFVIHEEGKSVSRVDTVKILKIFQNFYWKFQNFQFSFGEYLGVNIPIDLKAKFL